jgi:hypothetical protein
MKSNKENNAQTIHLLFWTFLNKQNTKMLKSNFNQIHLRQLFVSPVSSSSMKGTFRRLQTRCGWEAQLLELSFGSNGAQDKWLFVEKYVNSAQTDYDLFIFKNNFDDLILEASKPQLSWDLSMSSYLETHIPYKHFAWGCGGYDRIWPSGIISGPVLEKKVFCTLKTMYCHICDRIGAYSHWNDDESILVGTLEIDTGWETTVQHLVEKDNDLMKKGMKKEWKESFSDPAEPAARHERYNLYLNLTNHKIANLLN